MSDAIATVSIDVFSHHTPVTVAVANPIASAESVGNEDSSKPLVLYHRNCLDGFAAAWAAYRKFGAAAEYVAVQHGEPAPDCTDRDVIILDFSYKLPQMHRIHDQCKSLVLLDHHASAVKELWEFAPPKADVELDVTRSGCMIAWQYFHGPEVPVPWLIEYAQDYDLWKFELPKCRELTAVLMSHPYEFALWDGFASVGNQTQRLLHEFATGKDYVQEYFGRLIVEGEAILRFQQQKIDRICKHARFGSIDGHTVPIVNAPVFISGVGNQLCKGHPFAASWFVREDGKKIWSLRSDANGLDVSKIAVAHGGGGHKHAAGFVEGA